MTTINPSSLTTRTLGAPCESRSRSRIDSVANLTAIGMVGVLGMMLGRVAQLQISPGLKLAPFISERITVVPEKAPPGEITDRRGIPVATAKFGYRVFVDPIDFPNPPGEAINLLAEALGTPAPDIARRIVPAMDGNQEIIEARTDEDPPEETARFKRFVPVSGVLDDWRVDAVKGLRINGRPIPGVHLETRPVREYTAGALAANVVGMVGDDMAGLSGAERMYGPLMRPAPGALRYVRDARGEPMWIFPGGYTPPERGLDVRLSLDLEIQHIVVEELRRGVDEADAAGGRCVVMDPYTGEILAMADVVRHCEDARDYDWSRAIPKGGNGTRYRIIPQDTQSKIDPALARNRCVEDAYEPGSTFKPFMWSACLMHGVTRPGEVFNTFGGQWTTPYGRHIADVHGVPELAWTEVLVQSSNIGMAQGVARLSFPQARDTIVALGFGHKPGLGLPGESPGKVTGQKAWSKYTQTSVAFGYEVSVTPVQMCRAFSAFCRTGELAGTIPNVRLTATDYERALGEPCTRVFPASIADLTRKTMKGVTDILDKKLATQKGREENFRYISFGKSGTAQAPLGKAPEGKRKPKGSDGYYGGQYNVSFIAGGPFEDPRIVVLVVVDDPGPELVKGRRYYGALVAGPVNRRVMERSLGYLGVPPSVPFGASMANAEAGE